MNTELHKTTRFFARCGIVIALLASTVGLASAAPRLGRPECVHYAVVRGDTMWAISQRASIPFDSFVALNPHISNPSLIYPGDEVNLSCPASVAPAPAPQGESQPTPEKVAPGIQAMTNVAQSWAEWRETTEPCPRGTCYTWPAILIALHDAGFRGNDLITMAAIVPGESDRDANAIGDNTPQYLKDGWGPSVTIFQLRTHEKYTDTGYWRDINRLRKSVGEDARAAFECYSEYLQMEEKGVFNKVTQNKMRRFDAWSAYLNGWHKGHIEKVRNVAKEIGVLDV